MSYSCVFLIGRNIAYTLVGIIIDIAKEKRTRMGKTEKNRCVDRVHTYLSCIHIGSTFVCTMLSRAMEMIP